MGVSLKGPFTIPSEDPDKTCIMGLLGVPLVEKLPSINSCKADPETTDASWSVGLGVRGEGFTD